MSAERGGLLKTRAEDFARHLHTRLKSLSGTEEACSWAEVTSTDSEVYYDIDSSLGSPQEEVSEPIFVAAQNKDSLPLQRSESSGSEYFDSVEELPSSSLAHTTSIPFLKKIPILHLKTEKSVSLTNGHTSTIDANLGCSRVHEISCTEEEPCLTENFSVPVEENNCDISVVNNNTWKDVEQLIDKCDLIDHEPLILHCNGDLSLETETKPVNELSNSREAISNCVFCDIEQAKSSLSNKCTDELYVSQEEEKIFSQTDNSADKGPDNLKLKVPPEPPSECSSNNEDSVPLKDLLKVLKKEISEKQESEEQTLLEKTGDTEISEDNTASVCPSIEIRESTPTISTTDVLEPEEEEFDIETKRKNFRRCSSLKSGKTPPGTPGRKKIVRFADVLGLDLADVKTFLDEVPTVPKSAYTDLHLPPETDTTSVPASTTPCVTIVMPQLQKFLMPLFQQPCLTPNFMDRIRANNVCLESAAVSDMSLFAITGLVRVRNIDFNKSVYIRYTINGWRSYSDLQARYMNNSCDGFSDKFSFVLYAHTLSVGQRLEFAVRYQTSGAQFWDSNAGLNYVFECTAIPRTYSESSIPPSPGATWASFL